jgi:hypothetical protein
MTVSEFIKNNTHLAGVGALIIIGAFLFLCMVKALLPKREGLCNPEWGGCKATYMEDGWGIPYPQQSIEPQDPYLNSSMVVPEMPKNGVASENIKKKYLFEANKPYMHLDEDELNIQLLPAPGFLFVGP